MQPVHCFQWLNGTSWGIFLRENDFAFPLIETVYILGLGVSVGLIMWVDLRLLGYVMRDKPVSSVISAIELWAIVGFGVMFASGALLLLSEPMKCYTTLAFRIKAILLLSTA